MKSAGDRMRKRPVSSQETISESVETTWSLVAPLKRVSRPGFRATSVCSQVTRGEAAA